MAVMLVDHPTAPDFWRHEPPRPRPCAECKVDTPWIYLDLCHLHPECDFPAPKPPGETADRLEAVLARLDREVAAADEKVAEANDADPDSQYAASRRGWRRGLMQARDIVASALASAEPTGGCSEPSCVDGVIHDQGEVYPCGSEVHDEW